MHRETIRKTSGGDLAPIGASSSIPTDPRPTDSLVIKIDKSKIGKAAAESRCEHCYKPSLLGSCFLSQHPSCVSSPSSSPSSIYT